MDQATLHERARRSGANLLVYWIVRGLLEPFFCIYFRMTRIGREHIPAEGPVIVAANHRSFLDPFVIGTMVSRRRPMHYVAKKEVFGNRWLAWILNALGAFPVDRGAGDREMLETAKAILARGDIVLIFPEGTRIRPGSLGKPHRGVGRLALETGVPVVPVAVIGTEAVRRGWRIRPHKVRIRAGRPLRFPVVEKPSPQLATAVTERIWPCVMLQWEWLGGLPPIRRAAVIGAGSWGTSLAVSLARAGYDVDLACRTQEQAQALASTRVNDHYLPDVQLPDRVTVARASELELGGHDLICLAVPARALPAVLAAHGPRIPRRAGVLVLSNGLVPPLGTLPSAFCAERCRARAIAVLGGPAHAGALHRGASIVIASADRAFARQLRSVFVAARLDVSISSDVTGVELAGCAKEVAALAAAAAGAAGADVAGAATAGAATAGAATAGAATAGAATAGADVAGADVAGADVAGAAAGKVFGEVDALARAWGGKPETFAGLAGAGDLVATVVAAGSRNGRAGELLSQGVAPDQIAPMLGHAVEALDSASLLAAAARSAGVQAPALAGLAALVEGRIEPERWAETVTAPVRRQRSAPSRAA